MGQEVLASISPFQAVLSLCHPQQPPSPVWLLSLQSPNLPRSHLDTSPKPQSQILWDGWALTRGRNRPRDREENSASCPGSLSCPSQNSPVVLHPLLCSASTALLISSFSAASLVRGLNGAIVPPRPQ